jgi:hypothetical protein
LVLSAAEKDGGAHVDAELEPFYEDLASGMMSLGLDASDLTYNGPAPFDQSKAHYPANLHLAMIRQFGHEVQMAARHYDWLRRLSDRGLSPPRISVSRRRTGLHQHPAPWRH